VTDGVDAAVDSVKQATAEAVIDRILAKPQKGKLATSDHAVLPRRKVSD
jgi:hypothetical protein